jgi:cytoskeletal protein RodZ
MKEWHEKLKSLPKKKKQWIVWGAVVLVGLLLSLWWVNSFNARWRRVQESDKSEIINFPATDHVWEDVDKFLRRPDIQNIFSDELEEVEQENE